MGRRVANRILGKFTSRYLRATTKDCFIATTVYQDIDAPEVQSLREYRDEVLMNNRMGRRVIDLYYSGLGKRAAYLLGRDWSSAIPAIRICLDYVVERHQKRVKV